MENKRIRLFEIKRTKGKGEMKVRDCLGPGCKIRFSTTPDTRLCPKCKRNIEKYDAKDGYSVNVSNKRNGGN